MSDGPIAKRAKWTLLAALAFGGLSGVPASAQDTAPISAPIPAPRVLPTACPAAPVADPAFAKAAAAMQVGEYSHALALAGAVGDPLLSDVVRWESLSDPGVQAGFAEIEALIDRRPDWPGLGTLSLRAEKGLPPNAGADRIVRLFDRSSPDSFDGLMAYLSALGALGRSEDRDRIAREYWSKYSMRSDQQQAFLSAFGGGLGPDDHWRRADTLVWNDNLDQAERAAAFLDHGHQALIAARIKLRRSANGVDSAIARVPAELQSDEGLLYDRMRWRQAKGLDDGVVGMLERQPAIARYPRSWWRVRMLMAREALDDGKFDLAYRLAANHGQPGGVGLVESEWLAGWIALHRLQRPGQAAEHFSNLLAGSGTPISRSRGAYWLGESWQAMGDSEKAAHWWSLAADYPTAFYGQLASQRLGRLIPLAPPLALPPADLAAARFGDMGCLTLTLARLDAGHLAKPFLDAIARRAPDGDQTALASLAFAAGYPPAAVWAGKNLLTQGQWLPEAAYPQIEVPAFAGAPEPAIVLAIIRQETVFDQHAVSRAGARGLMQLMPGTASDVARKIGLTVSQRDLTEQPAVNMRLGSEYFKSMLARYDNSYLLAIAAYNAGPGNANRWITRYGDPRDPQVDVRHWIESIPYPETRNYVQRVMEATIVYRRLSGQNGGEAQLSSLLASR